MKKFILSIIFIITLSIILTACSTSNLPESKGLLFKSNGDGTCSVIGIGTCTDTDLVIPEKSPDEDIVTSIGSKAFHRDENEANSKITSVTLPKTVVQIGDEAFSYLHNINKVNFNDGLQKIGENAFYGCDKIEKLDFPESLTDIGKSAFNGLDKLKELTIPKNVTKLNDDAFQFCKSLETLTIEGKIEELTNQFSNCDNITVVNLKNDFTYYHASISDIEKGYSVKLFMDAPDEIGYSDSITRENRSEIYCRYFNKDKMTLNGEEIVLPERNTISGFFGTEIKNIALEFIDNNKCKIYGHNGSDYQLFAECSYTYDNNKKLFVIDDEKASLKVVELDRKYIYVEGEVMDSGNKAEIKTDLTKDVKA